MIWPVGQSIELFYYKFNRLSQQMPMHAHLCISSSVLYTVTAVSAHCMLGRISWLESTDVIPYVQRSLPHPSSPLPSPPHHTRIRSLHARAFFTISKSITLKSYRCALVFYSAHVLSCSGRMHLIHM